jgi:hypothetical protein
MKIAQFALLASTIGLSAAQAAVQYIGDGTGAVSTVIDLSANPTATWGGSYDSATKVWTWDHVDDIVLNNIVAIKNGTLSIPAGKIVRGQPAQGSGVFNPGALLIARSAKIVAVGDPTTPIIFTSAATSAAGARATGASPAYFDANPVASPLNATIGNLWGGVIVLGNAPTNVDRDATGIQELDEESAVKGVTDDDRSSIEGIPTTASVFLSGDDRFGGQKTNDNSGALSYVSIRHAGANLSANNEINGLTLGGVGSGTTINNIEIWGNSDDGVEIFGGSVNLRNVAIFGVQDDGLDLDVGYTGTVQNLLVVAANTTDRLGEWDGDYSSETVNGFTTVGPVAASGIPYSAFTIANATFVGNKGAANFSHGFHIRDQTNVRLVNSIIVNAAQNATASAGPIEVDNRTGVAAPRRTTDGFTYGRSYFKGVTFQSPTFSTVAAWVANGNDDTTVEASLGNADYANIFNGNVGFVNIPTGGTLSAGLGFDPRPQADADAVAEDAVAGATANYVFLPFRGAFDPFEGNLWTNGWTAAATSGLLVP